MGEASWDDAEKTGTAFLDPRKDFCKPVAAMMCSGEVYPMPGKPQDAGEDVVAASAKRRQQHTESQAPQRKPWSDLHHRRGTVVSSPRRRA